MCSGKKNSWIIPFGGNGFITNGDDTPTPTLAVMTPCGVSNWASTSSTISLYFHMQYPGKVLVALRLRVQSGSSKISFTLRHNDDKLMKEDVVIIREVELASVSEFHLVNIGTFVIPSAGYVRIDLRGLERTGPTYAIVSHALIVSETYPLLEPTYVRFVDDPADFYFGRRGPSVHMHYDLPSEFTETEYFYNEIYVPKDQDVIGAYFCAMGFTGGYFGIQVNSEHERRVLFSIWSEYNSDNPAEIPHDYKVKLIRNGNEVFVGEFGNEGSGAQSYLRHMWKPETTYGFIVQAKPIDSERTMYTAWFNPDSSKTTLAAWRLIASFEKPKASTYFKNPYSFSENFIPEMGFVERHCMFSNQWACSKNGSWKEIVDATFTADATAAKETRMDIAGGVGIDGDNKRFYLRNCGFFSDRVKPRTPFTRENSGKLPPVDVSTLP